MTIYEIAKRAGVSSSTVARVLRGDVRESFRKSAETARRVRALAKEMGYRPNLRARAFSRRRTRSVGLVYDEQMSIFSGVNAAICNGIVRGLQVEQHHLIFLPINETGDWLDALFGGQLDGAIVLDALPEVLRGSLSAPPIPFVLVGDGSEQSLSRLFFDDFAGGYLATKHLLGLNHRRVMFFVHESVKSRNGVLECIRGHRSAMNEVNACGHECIQTSEVTALEEFIRPVRELTAAICYSEVESILLAHGLWQCGLKVPEDVSIVGFNDVFAIQHMTPPLTTIAYDATQLGEKSAKLILQEIAAWPKMTPPTPTVLKPKLLVRGSTGAIAT